MWQFDGRLARWQGTAPEFSIDVQQPELGLQQIRLDRSLPPLADARLLRVELVRPGTARPAASDAYVRGDDLIASYSTSDSPFGWQIYWRRAETDSGLEVVLSLQNRLLSGNPAIRVTSSLPSNETWYFDPNGQPLDAQAVASRQVSPAIIAIALDDQWAYAEWVHPADVQDIQFHCSATTVTTEWTVFGDGLEKGVIRRARLRGEFLLRASLTTELPSRLQSFLHSPIPLST